MQEQNFDSMSSSDIRLNIHEVRAFYFNEFMVIHDALLANMEEQPEELNFEISAAFDHLMRIEQLDDEDSTYQKNLEKAFIHLKRATLDGFKLLFKYPIRSRYMELKTKWYNGVNNGQFIPEVESLWNNAKEIVIQARKLERFPTTNGNTAFDEWKKLLSILRKYNELYESEGAKRARASMHMIRMCWQCIKGSLFGIILGVIVEQIIEWIIMQI